MPLCKFQAPDTFGLNTEFMPVPSRRYRVISPKVPKGHSIKKPKLATASFKKILFLYRTLFLSAGFAELQLRSHRKQHVKAITPEGFPTIWAHNLLSRTAGPAAYLLDVNNKPPFLTIYLPGKSCTSIAWFFTNQPQKIEATCFVPPQPSTVSLPTSQKSMMPAACTTF